MRHWHDWRPIRLTACGSKGSLVAWMPSLRWDMRIRRSTFNSSRPPDGCSRMIDDTQNLSIWYNQKRILETRNATPPSLKCAGRHLGLDDCTSGKGGAA